jgi:DNA-directed RNA polymerase specialized sigma24 family protein
MRRYAAAWPTSLLLPWPNSAIENHAKEIRDAIESLPSKQLAAVLMHKYEGMDHAAIAEVLECSIPALKSLLFRAYETLRRRLAHFAPPSVA